MPVKNGKIKKASDVMKAIEKYQPFRNGPANIRTSVVSPAAYSNHEDYKLKCGGKANEKKHRALIKDADTGKILLSAGSNYELVKKIEDGWIYEPNKREGLFITDGLLKENDDAGKT